jgi:hypothetical protein
MDASTQFLNHATVARSTTHVPGWDGGREPRVLQCPRPSCGGRMFVVDVALDEQAAVCMLCARSVSAEYAAVAWRAS